MLRLLRNMQQIGILSTVVGVTTEYRASFLGIYLLGWLSGTTVTDEPLSCQATETYRVFSHEVMAAILVSQNNETAAMLVSQTNPVWSLTLFLCKRLLLLQ